MPAYNSGDPAWAKWSGSATQAAAPVASPWPSSSPASSSVGPGGTPWTAALSQGSTTASAGQQTTPDPTSTVQVRAAGEQQPGQTNSRAPARAAVDAAEERRLTDLSKCGEYVVEWEYSDQGSWYTYSRRFMDRLEQYYQSPGPEKAFTWKPRGNVEFEYNVQEMWQMNLETKGRRCIRRVLTWAAEWEALPEREAAVLKHNADNKNLDACYARTGRQSRSQGAGPARTARSRSRM